MLFFPNLVTYFPFKIKFWWSLITCIEYIYRDFSVLGEKGKWVLANFTVAPCKVNLCSIDLIFAIHLNQFAFIILEMIFSKFKSSDLFQFQIAFYISHLWVVPLITGSSWTRVLKDFLAVLTHVKFIYKLFLK